MQLMPATARMLGVDPYDFQQNIRGGVRYLAQMFRQFGSWDLALQAYNWGPQKLQSAIAAGRSSPAQVQAYASGVLGPGASSPATSGGYLISAADQAAAGSNDSPTATVLALLGGAAALYALIL
jgi:soluble lytic murein transglycosylase-like protein